MASTLCCHLVHVIFSTKNREPIITETIAPRLHAFIGGVARNRDCPIVAIGGVEDHVHLLIALHPGRALGDLVRDLKANSSRWMHEEVRVPQFAWQAGYAAFSVSCSNVGAVRAYIENQCEHHVRRSFKEELIEFLQRHGVEYDERYVLG